MSVVLFLKETLEVSMKRVPNAPECGQSLLLRVFDSCGIFDAPMDTLCFGREERAALLCIVADRNHNIEILSGKFIDGFGPVRRDINTDFTHHRDGFGPHMTGMRTCTEDLVTIPSIVPEQTFRHLASRRVPGAKDKNASSITH
jgi:hypothetical protein